MQTEPQKCTMNMKDLSSPVVRINLRMRKNFQFFQYFLLLRGQYKLECTGFKEGTGSAKDVKSYRIYNISIAIRQ